MALLNKNKRKPIMKQIYLLFFLITIAALSTGCGNKTPGEELFDDSYVHTVKVNFAQKDFWDSLKEYRSVRDSLEITRYMMCSVMIDGEPADSAGIRFKGESSYDFTSTRKKSFKISFNKFVKRGRHQGLRRISLNNNFKDPTMMREKLMLDFYRAQGLPAQRSSYAKLYINDVYWGLYLVVEEINDEFLAHNFGSDTGNLYMGEPRPTLEYFGDDLYNYIRRYKRKNNRKDSNWTDLTALLKKINDTVAPPADYKASLEKELDTDNLLKAWAINNLFVNVDAYNMLYPHNYYLYFQDEEKRFKWISYDFNYGFGAWTPRYDLQQVTGFDIYYVHDREARVPLATQLLRRNHITRQAYAAQMQELAEKHFTPENLFPEIDKIAALIRESVYADTLKMYSNEDFENNITKDIGDVRDPGAFTPGLKPFIERRRESVLKQLGNTRKESL